MTYRIIIEPPAERETRSAVSMEDRKRLAERCRTLV